METAEKVIIKFKMDTFDLNGNPIMQEFEHGVNAIYYENKLKKLNRLTADQVAKWIIKQAYKTKEVEIVEIIRK